jgi:Holliday junction resolvase RusA-like endonuclease
MEENNIPFFTHDKKLKIYITFFFKGNYRRDLDNASKLFLDCLSSILYVDDDQIYKLVVEKRIGCKSNKICMAIEKLDEIELKLLDLLERDLEKLND